MKIIIIFVAFIYLNIPSLAQPTNPKLALFCSTNYDRFPSSKQLVRIYWQPATDSTIIGYWIKGYNQGNYYNIKYVLGRDSNFTTFNHTWKNEDSYFSIFSIDSLGREYSDSNLFTTIWKVGGTQIMGTALRYFTSIDYNINKTRYYEYRWTPDSIAWEVLKTYNISGKGLGDISYATYPPSLTRKTGWYQVVTHNDACSVNNTSYLIEWVSNPNGMTEYQSFSGISFYPNPSSGTVNFILPEALKGKNIKVQLLNILGEVLEEASVSDARSDCNFNTSVQLSGLYFLKIENNPILRKVVFNP